MSLHMHAMLSVHNTLLRRVACTHTPSTPATHPLTCPATHLLTCNFKCLSFVNIDTQTGVRGYQKVEEYDPMERMKRLATGPAVSSLEEELKTMQVGCGRLQCLPHCLLWE
jgi:hypothetical protein